MRCNCLKRNPGALSGTQYALASEAARGEARIKSVPNPDVGH